MAGRRSPLSTIVCGASAWLIPLGKLWALLVVLPLILTYAHLRYGLARTETCFVGPTGVDQRITMGGMGGDTANTFTWDTLTNREGVVHDSTTITTTTMMTLANVDGLYGAYRPLGPPSPMTNQKKREANTNGRSFLLVDRPALSRSSSSFFAWKRFILGGNGWPSIAIVAHRVSAWSRRLPLVPSSSDTNSLPHGRIEFKPKTQQWCLTTAKHGEGADDRNLMVCSDPSSLEVTKNVDKDVMHVLPPSGIWKGTHPANGSTTLAIQVTCPGPSTIPMEGVASSSNSPKKGNVSSKRSDKIKGMEQQLFRKNPGKKQDVRRKEALEQLLPKYIATFVWTENGGAVLPELWLTLNPSTSSSTCPLSTPLAINWNHHSTATIACTVLFLFYFTTSPSFPLPPVS
eukprot:scaffold147405_cov42-Attheya_sp.AAC.5